MNWKKFWIGLVVVYLVGQVLSILIHAVWLGETYSSLSSVWRPEADLVSKQWIMMVTAAVFSFFFCYVFVRGREGKGVAEGVRYGVVIGLFVGIPQAYNFYALLPIPYSLALKWFLSGIVSTMILGAIFAAIYKPKSL